MYANARDDREWAIKYLTDALKDILKDPTVPHENDTTHFMKLITSINESKGENTKNRSIEGWLRLELLIRLYDILNSLPLKDNFPIDMNRSLFWKDMSSYKDEKIREKTIPKKLRGKIIKGKGTKYGWFSPDLSIKANNKICDIEIKTNASFNAINKDINVLKLINNYLANTKNSDGIYSGGLFLGYNEGDELRRIEKFKNYYQLDLPPILLDGREGKFYYIIPV